MKKGSSPYRLQNRSMHRRSFLRLLAAAGVLPAMSGMARSRPRVVIVGAGYGGATCARYLAYANAGIDIVLVEASRLIHTCPFSNYVIGGFFHMDDLTWSLRGLEQLGVTVVCARALAFDPSRKTLTLDDGQNLTWDRLVLSPGIDVHTSAIEGYDAKAVAVMPHAWKAGPQTLDLARRLRAVKNGGVVVITVPDYPYRCPPAPYERAAVMAWYLKNHGRERCKILIFDAKSAFTKQDLFRQGWEQLYPGMIEWTGGDDARLIRVDAAAMRLYMAGGDTVRCDLANVIAPQRAAKIARDGGLGRRGPEGGNWCRVNGFTLESREVPNVHVLGDSIVPGDMPKSGFAANAQGKACAAALVAILHERSVRAPVFMNVCYSLLGPDYGISIAGLYRAGKKRITAIGGAGGVSPLSADRSFRRREARAARGWYEAMAQEMYGVNRGRG